MLSYYAREAQMAFGLAMTEVKFEALANSDWKRRVRNKQRQQTLKYDLTLPRK